MMNRIVLSCGILLLLVSGVRGEEEVTLSPTQDTTIFSEDGTLQNGLGTHLFSGLTNGSDARRALLSFDIAGSLPPDAIVTSAALTLTVDRVNGAFATDDFGLHRVSQGWVEGDVISDSRGGGGGQSGSGGATWTTTGTAPWENEGGDFVEAASASLLIADAAAYTWESTEQLVSDVQLWLDDPSLNFGWAVVGNEIDQRSAKRFVSAQNDEESLRPTLSIEFENSVVETLLGDFDGDNELLANDIDLLCAAVRSGENAIDFDLNADGVVDLEDQRVWVEDVRGTFFGDADLDGSVLFPDFLALSNSFGQSPFDGGWAMGDHDCDSEVNFSDFLLLSANFGSVGEAAASASVPEPNGGLWVALFGILILRRRS